jgi:LysR family hca operon transcriptional activator
MGMSLIASTRGVGLLPAYALNFLPSSITSRPLKGNAPTVELVLGYKKSNESPILKLLLSRLDELVARVSKKANSSLRPARPGKGDRDEMRNRAGETSGLKT